MFFLIGTTFVMIVGVVLIVGFILWWTDRTAHRSITARFREAEYILHSHRVPAAWARTGRRGRGQPRDRKAEILVRLDDLIAFFEVCPFFDREETRHHLLSQLRVERRRWEETPSEELVAGREASEPPMSA
ncbi:MAG: hypothetical protein D6791_16000 [Chloroflexi bacterium]|nr:MAG: hypothetical protein D6791_16000 [Chloroflexota bacterium]